MRARILPLAAAVLACACATRCGGPSVSTSGERYEFDAGRYTALNSHGYFRTFRDTGGMEHVGRIDGNIEAQFTGRLTADEDQFVILSGLLSGADQSKLIVSSTQGQLLCDYRIPSISPFKAPPSYRRTDDETLQHPLSSTPQLVQPVQLDGRRYVVLGASGLWAPSCLVVLEAASRSELVERSIFWNFGVIGEVKCRDRWIILGGVHNSTQEQGDSYSRSVAVFDLAEMVSGVRPRGVSPYEDAPGAAPDRQYVVYAQVPPDPLISWQRLEVLEGVLEAESESGLTFRVPMDGGKVDVRASPEFAAAFERAQRFEALADYLQRMARDTKVWRRE